MKKKTYSRRVAVTIDMPPKNWSALKVGYCIIERDYNEKEDIQRRTDHRNPA